MKPLSPELPRESTIAIFYLDTDTDLQVETNISFLKHASLLR